MVYVENEFAPLQKVILAVSEFGFPKAVRADDLRFLPDTNTESDVTNAGKDFAEVYPEQQKHGILNAQILLLYWKNMG
ncbi:hypothetical protein KUH03_27525 [Sphingobacterium sp. E70]|uniref:hypothetical protein n=1 Tax=Sphingobacterium sp. E70 TaxID=2853439 RepID=UPI00211C33AF|nr:hypothetical protein [Sphingobacterium sp. E70]ULT22989.1 hypothetical protein KUH03_27525 [Sphingobacterium sp. E70]